MKKLATYVITDLTRILSIDLTYPYGRAALFITVLVIVLWCEISYCALDLGFPGREICIPYTITRFSKILCADMTYLVLLDITELTLICLVSVCVCWA